MKRFFGRHKGETALLVGNGPNLHKTPPEWFMYPSFGMNTIHKYEGWIPTYYTAVDSRVMREFGSEIAEKYRDIPKFIPTPNLDAWQGENFYRFYHRPGPLFPTAGIPLNADFMAGTGISYGNVMHVAMQLAAWMGFKVLLMVGVEHKPLYARAHFWGPDEGMSSSEAHIPQWMDGYREIVKHLSGRGVRVLNISEQTHVPQDVLPRGDWRDWRNDED